MGSPDGQDGYHEWAGALGIGLNQPEHVAEPEAALDAHLAIVDSHSAQLRFGKRRRELSERHSLRRRATRAHTRHTHQLQLRWEATQPPHQTVGEVVLAAARTAAPRRAHVDWAVLPRLLRIDAVDADEAVLLGGASEALRLGHGDLCEAARVEVA
eukprot:1543569-Prymnesium_polylepis.1